MKKRLRLVLLAAAVLILFSVTVEQVPPSGAQGTPDRTPCLANNTIPPGHTSCVGPDGRTWVAPPLRMTFSPGGRVVVPPPSASRGDRSRNENMANSPTPVGTGSAGPSSSPSVWWTIGGVGAIAALLTGLAALINAVRRK